MNILLNFDCFLEEIGGNKIGQMAKKQLVAIGQFINFRKLKHF
jgi:hypothetical protein